MAKMTSKNQITIPADIVRKSGLKAGHHINVDFEDSGRIVLTPAELVVEELAGLLKGKGPKRWDTMDADEIIEDARLKYFKKTRRYKLM